MTERLIAALAIFAGKTERQGVSLIDILARAAHTQFGLQRDDILPTQEEVDDFLIEHAGYVRDDENGTVSRDPETGRFVSQRDFDDYVNSRSPEAVAVLDAAPPEHEPVNPLSTADRAPAEMTAPLPTGEPRPPVVPVIEPRPEASPAPLEAPPASEERAALTETGGAQTSSLG